MEAIQNSTFAKGKHKQVKTRSKFEIDNLNNPNSKQKHLEPTCVGELRIKPYKMNSKKVKISYLITLVLVNLSNHTRVNK